MRALTGAFALLALVHATSAATQTRVDQAVFAALADDLLRSMPADVKVAIKPFGAGNVDLPAAVTERFNNEFLHHLFSRSQGRIRVIARSDLLKIWDEVAEFQVADISELAAEADVDVLIVGHLAPMPDGLEISYKAYDTKAGRTGQIVASTQTRFHPFDLDKANIMRLPVAVAYLVNQIVPQLEHAEAVGARGAMLQRTGRVSPFGDYFIGQFMEALQAQIAGSVGKGTRFIILGQEAGQRAQPGQFLISGTIWDHGDEVVVKIKVEDDLGLVVQKSARILTASIPATYLPLTVGGGLVVGGKYEADGGAVIGANLNENAALLAARNLARARVVAQALDESRLPATDFVRDVTDASRFFALLSLGLTYDEEWLRETVSNGRALVRLRAKVKRTGTAGAPLVAAEVSPPIIAAGDPIEISLTSDTSAYVAVFAWQADDKVIRVFPMGSDQAIRIEPGRELILPRRHDPFVLTSEPMPGSTADHEGFVVLTSLRPLNYDALAPGLGGSIEETMARAVPMSAFFDRLAEQDLAASSVKFLPYQVTAAAE